MASNAKRVALGLYPARLAPPPWANRPKNGAPAISIAYNRFGGYCVPMDAAHRPAARTVLAGRVWEPLTIQILRDLGRGGDIVHAGTFFGDALPALSAEAERVWAFEPNPRSYLCARITVELNGLTNVDLSNAALSGRLGHVQLRTADDRGRSLGGASRVEETGDSACIATIIDAAVPDDRLVTVIHLDVEGHEVPALEGARATIERCRPALVLEKLPGATWTDPDWMQRCLRGYRVIAEVEGNALLQHQSGR